MIGCTAVGLQPAHSEKAPVPKPPKLEEEKKEEKKEGKEGKEKKESTLKPGKYKVAEADFKNGVVYLKPLYKPKPVIPVKVPPRVIRKLRPGTVVEVHHRGSSTVIRTASGTAEGSTVITRTESSSGTMGNTTSSSEALQTGSTSSSTSTPSHTSVGTAGAGTYGNTTVKAKEKTVSSEGGKTAGSSKSKESKGKREKKEKNRSSKEKIKVKRPKSSGSSDLELQREASSGSSSGWAPYLVAIALVGAATGGMWLVKQRRSTTWEWE
jgi:hypothetical protein